MIVSEDENITPLVADFEIACLLHRSGFPQKTAFYWCKPMVISLHALPYLSGKPEDAVAAAPTSEEIGRFLPSQYATMKVGELFLFIDLMATTYRPAEESANGGGIILNRIRGAEDKTEVGCKAKGLLHLLRAGGIRFAAKT